MKILYDGMPYRTFFLVRAYFALVKYCSIVLRMH
jgi:hypothetical protein